MEKPYPLRLEKAPIVEAIVEIRFTSSLPADAVFGVIHGQLKEEYPNHKELPIMQLPAEIRKKEATLIHQAYYQLSGHSPLLIGIGPKVLSISYAKYSASKMTDYPGWTDYMASEASRVIEISLAALPEVKIERLGIRYQDFFKSVNIFDGTEPSFEFPQRTTKSLMVKTSIVDKDMVHGITISNSANINIQKEDGIRIESGSILDIDTAIDNIQENMFDNTKELLTRVHDTNKELFYEILKKDFVNSLGAVYPSIEK